MALTEADIFLRVQDLLFDTAGARWPTAELRRWLNDGQRIIALAKPDATATTQARQLSAGCKQSCPAGTIRLLDVVRNLGSNGTTPGKGIRVCERETLNAYNPAWSTDATSTTVQNFMYDERNPLEFYVYPPVPASPAVYVEIITTALPTDTTTGSSALSIGDWYADALVDYVLWRAFSKDAEQGAAGPQAERHYMAVVNMLGIAAAELIKSSPNAASEDGKFPKSAQVGG